jgi:hypothetical protein
MLFGLAGKLPKTTINCFAGIYFASSKKNVSKKAKCSDRTEYNDEAAYKTCSESNGWHL